jgi:sulfur carrier protein ThiS
MGAKPATAEKNGVILIRMGVGREEVALPEGATLADLLRAARIEEDGQEILIDGRPLEESLVLQPGSIVTVSPGRKNDGSRPLWWDSVGMFRDDPTFEEMMKRIEARRDSERDDS